MYGAVRERAPNSTRMAGMSAALLMTATLGYALANGIGGQIVKLIEPPLVFTPLEDVPPPVERDPAPALPTDTSLPAPPPISGPTEEFKATEETGGLTVTPGEKVETGTGGGGGTRMVPSPVRTRPVMIVKNPPPYPAAEIRKQNAGITGVEVCVDTGGRVTSAVLASSSGHTALDDAALKWVRNARFTPGKVDGVPQPVCGHDVTYEWKLENARR